MPRQRAAPANGAVHQPAALQACSRNSTTSQHTVGAPAQPAAALDSVWTKPLASAPCRPQPAPRTRLLVGCASQHACQRRAVAWPLGQRRLPPAAACRPRPGWTHPAGRPAMSARQNIRTLVRRLRLGNDPAQAAQAAKELGRALLFNPALCREAASAGAAPALVQLLSGSHGPELREQARAALLPLSLGQPQSVAAAGGIPSLVLMLDSPGPEVAVCAAAALGPMLAATRAGRAAARALARAPHRVPPPAAGAGCCCSRRSRACTCRSRADLSPCSTSATSTTRCPVLPHCLCLAGLSLPYARVCLSNCHLTPPGPCVLLLLYLVLSLKACGALCTQGTAGPAMHGFNRAFKGRQR